MFRKIKSKIARVAVIALTAIAVLGGAAAGTLVTAETAQAVNRQCHYVDAGYGRIIGGSPWPGYRYGVACYYDYSWWEEVSFPWPRDGWGWQAWSNSYCAYPARNYVSC